MKKMFHPHGGMRLISLPRTQAERGNASRRGVTELGNVTASEAIAQAGIRVDAPMLFSGTHSAALPFLRQLIRKVGKPFVLIGTGRQLGENDCLRALRPDWTLNEARPHLPHGNGILTLDMDGDSMLEFKANLCGWGDHLPVVCLGDGLLLDKALLDRLNGHGSFILISGAMSRSLRGAEENGALTLRQVFASMGYLMISAIDAAAAQELLAVLPAYEEERVTNAIDWQGSRSRFHTSHGTRPADNGGFRFSQSRTLDTRPILRQEDLRAIVEERRTLLYNANTSAACVARITR